MHLGRPIIDSERAQLAEDLMRRGIVGHAETAEDLNRAVADAIERFGHRHLGHTGFFHRCFAAVECLRRPVREESGLAQIDFVVRKLKADALMIDKPLTVRSAAHGIPEGDVMRALSRAKPSHAMGEARGRQPNLRVAEALSDFAEHAVGANSDILQFDDRVSAWQGAVDGIEHTDYKCFAKPFFERIF